MLKKRGAYPPSAARIVGLCFVAPDTLTVKDPAFFMFTQMNLVLYFLIFFLRLLLDNATAPNAPPTKGITEGNPVGIAVIQPIIIPFPIANHHSSLNPYLWINTLGMVSAIATPIEIPQLAPSAFPDANNIQSTANIPKPTNG
jgi:hypothetical protein